MAFLKFLFLLVSWSPGHSVSKKKVLMRIYLGFQAAQIPFIRPAFNFLLLGSHLEEWTSYLSMWQHLWQGQLNTADVLQPSTSRNFSFIKLNEAWEYTFFSPLPGMTETGPGVGRRGTYYLIIPCSPSSLPEEYPYLACSRNDTFEKLFQLSIACWSAPPPLFYSSEGVGCGFWRKKWKVVKIMCLLSDRDRNHVCFSSGG